MRKPKITPPERIVPDPNEIARQSGLVTQVREYELITPLFGGGTTSGEPDPVTVIRGTEIRGQLRFWWRACRGGQSKFHRDMKAMKEEEDRIWGKAYKKGEEPVHHNEAVQIMVHVVEEGTRVKPFEYQKDAKGQFIRDNRLKIKTRTNRDIPTYAAFSLQPTDEECRQEDPPPEKTVSKGVTFQLSITFPESRKADIEAALWAWETFGGIGARTRRGFGALCCQSIEENGKAIPVDLSSANMAQTIQWLRNKLIQHVTEGSWPAGVPYLARQLTDHNFKPLVSRTSSDVYVVWNDLIDRLKAFRQARRQGRNQRPNQQGGRSQWPEPTAIRKLTGQSDRKFSDPIPEPPIHKFLRAVFGLPIIFQFKDSNKQHPDDKKSDPRKTVLQLEHYDRLASPLILKPLACRSKTYLGLALILQGTGLREAQAAGEKQEHLVLKAQEGAKMEQEVRAELESKEDLRLRLGAANREFSITSQTDALQAFLTYLEGGK
ncbi:MAG: type III-B CRISPR module RAMP protein Cmr1 [Ktedonobacteraceae bacterium]|nr:type III-B CRISPR module RAMP protein Cmr1 [Ktedonobacteraceae bacterium]